MQNDAHQPAFAGWRHVRYGKYRLRSEFAVLIKLHTAGTLGKKHSSVRRPNYRPRHFKIADYRLHPKLDLSASTWRRWRRHALSRRFDFSSASTGRRMSTRQHYGRQVTEQDKTAEKSNRERGKELWEPACEEPSSNNCLCLISYRLCLFSFPHSQIPRTLFKSSQLSVEYIREAV